MKKKIEYIFVFIICFIAFNNLGRAILYILNYIGLDIASFSYVDQAYYSTMMEIIYLFIVALLYRKCLKKDLVLFKLNKKDYINKILKYFLVFMIVKFSSAFIESLLSIILDIGIGGSSNQNIIEMLFKRSPVIMFIDCVVLAPFVEECIFRLGIKKIINNKYIFITISGLLFGFMHVFPVDYSYVSSLVQSITYITMGISLAYIYEETNNIWVTIGIHALNNFIGIISLLALL